MPEVSETGAWGRIAAGAVSEFGLKLLAAQAAQRQRTNVFLSPLSLFLGLAMVENGAEGETRAAIRRALAVPADLSEDGLQAGAAGLQKTLRAREDIELSIANALWSDRSLPLAPAFIERCKQRYEASAASLDFTQPAAADVINGWVERQTREKIRTIVTPEMVAASKAILTNAVYFRGRWRDPFPKSETGDGEFHLATGAVKKVPMMHNAWLRRAGLSGAGFEGVAMPYQYSGAALYAILPAPGRSPEDVLAGLTADRLFSSADSEDVDLRLPRFAFDFSAEMKEVLRRLGMGIAFEFPGAEFAPLGSPLFYLGEVLHKTRLEVDEEGTVAAAATAALMRAGSAMARPARKKVLVFDRPFGVLLIDIPTRAILFAGVVYEP
jgi:serpin B